jgi:hypothetical protein
LPEGFKDEIVRLAHDPFFLGGLVAAITGYIVLWLVPEPIFSKIAAACVTLAILSTGLFSVALILKVGSAWMALQDEAGGAQSDDQVEAAAKHFGDTMGGAGADLLIFLAQFFGAKSLPLPKGAAAASEALQAATKTLESAAPGTQVARSADVIDLFPRPPQSQGGWVDGTSALKMDLAPAPGFVPEPVTLPEPTPVPANDVVPAPGPTASPVPVPVPPILPGQPKPKCSPTGLSEDDAISFVWFKPRVDDFYPKEIQVAGSIFDRDSPPSALPTGKPIGVENEFWPSIGKVLQLLPEDRGDNAERFRAVLQRNGFNWEGLQADHVRDLGFGGPDEFSNLWPLDNSANMSAGARTQGQPITMCVNPEEPAPVTGAFAVLKKSVRLFGRFFRITSVTR